MQQVWPHIGYIFDVVETPSHTFLCLDGKNGRMTEVDAQGKVLGFVTGENYLRGQYVHYFQRGCDTGFEGWKSGDGVKK